MGQLFTQTISDRILNYFMEKRLYKTIEIEHRKIDVYVFDNLLNATENGIASTVVNKRSNEYFVAITRRAIKVFTKDELDSIIYHELGHILYDKEIYNSSESILDKRIKAIKNGYVADNELLADTYSAKSTGINCVICTLNKLKKYTINELDINDEGNMLSVIEINRRIAHLQSML